MIDETEENPRECNSAASVFIVDDNATIREALSIILRGEPDLDICGEAANAEDALVQYELLKPDISLIDISLKGTSGIDLIHDFRVIHPETKCVVFSLHDEALYIDAARKAGAHGYITKGDAPREIINGLRRVRDGEHHFPEPYSP